MFIWQSYYSHWKIKIEPQHLHECTIGRAIRAFTSGPLRGETLNHHIVAMGSSSEPSYLGNPITFTDKLLGHVCFMGKVFKIFKSQHNYIQHVT